MILTFPIFCLTGKGMSLFTKFIMPIFSPTSSSGHRTDRDTNEAHRSHSEGERCLPCYSLVPPTGLDLNNRAHLEGQFRDADRVWRPLLSFARLLPPAAK